MPDILHRLTIKSQPRPIYEALTTASGVRRWWTEDADLDAEVGGRATFRFGANRVKEARIETLTPHSRVEWSIERCFLPPWVGTRITFDLIPDGGATTVAFFHRGFAAADEIYALTTTGWGYYLVSLQQLIERGAGAPSPYVDFARMIA